MKKIFILLVLVLLIIVCGVVGYLAWTKPLPRSVPGTPINTASGRVIAVSPAASPTGAPSNGSVFVNEPHRLSFVLPQGYFVGSNHYGVTDAAKAETLFFRKKSESYADVPTLSVVARAKTPSGKPLEQLVRAIYDENKAKEYTASEVQIEQYAGTIAYLFDLKDGYENQGGYQRLELPLARIVFLERDGKIFEFLQTGQDLGLESILTSMKFN